jgi:Pyridoxamine 5'-phosphate oxidase
MRRQGKDIPMHRSLRVIVRRHPERGVYDVEAIHAILDEGFLCRVGFVQDDQPFVIPTLYTRVARRSTCTAPTSAGRSTISSRASLCA